MTEKKKVMGVILLFEQMMGLVRPMHSSGIIL